MIFSLNFPKFGKNEFGTNKVKLRSKIFVIYKYTSFEIGVKTEFTVSCESHPGNRTLIRTACWQWILKVSREERSRWTPQQQLLLKTASISKEISSFWMKMSELISIHWTVRGGQIRWIKLFSLIYAVALTKIFLSV